VPDTNIIGADYRNSAPGSDDWSLCQSARRAESKCMAWTLVHPGVQESNPRCWLKDKIPKALPSNCCTSGISTVNRLNSRQCSTPEAARKILALIPDDERIVNLLRLKFRCHNAYGTVLQMRRLAAK
jgi:PAN domain